MELYRLTIHEAHELLKKREISSKELTKALIDRIEKMDGKIGAYITVCKDSALKDAEAADKAISEGKIDYLTGIPLAIKDLICTKDIKTTCASKILENFIPFYDAEVIKKLKNRHAVILGKTNMDEFAMGSTTENSALKLTKNPWNLNRSPGGSSGGSAASVAADMCLGALGSDTGGSIRQPASHCSVTGLKPTYGRVSRFGLVAFGSSLDQIGPISKDVLDCAIILNGIAGFDASDSTSIDKPVPDYTKNLKADIKNLKIGIPKEYGYDEGIDKDVSEAVKNGVKILEDMGAECVEISLPHSKYVVAAYYLIATSEASSNLARYDGVKYGYRDEHGDSLISMYKNTRNKGFGSEVIRRIILGTYALSSGYYDAYYKKASQLRTLIINDYKKAFELCDVIASPVAPAPAFKIGEVEGDPLAMYLSDIFTLSANMAGIPGISIPCGFSKNGLPIGLQLSGNYFEEETLLKFAFNFQQVTDFHKNKPTL